MIEDFSCPYCSEKATIKDEWVVTSGPVALRRKQYFHYKCFDAHTIRAKKAKKGHKKLW